MTRFGESTSQNRYQSATAITEVLRNLVTYIVFEHLPEQSIVVRVPKQSAGLGQRKNIVRRTVPRDVMQELDGQTCNKRHGQNEVQKS